MAHAARMPVLSDALDVVSRAVTRGQGEALLSVDLVRRLARALEVIRDTPRTRLGDRPRLEDLDSVATILIRQLEETEGPARDPARRCAWQLLDVLRLPHLLRRVGEAGLVDACMEQTVSLVEASDFTIHALLRQRVDQYGPRTWLRRFSGARGKRWSWLDAATQIDRVARGLLALLGPPPHKPVAILSENRPEMIFADLACLTTGLVDVMVPPGATDTDIAYILDHSRAGTLIVSSPALLAKAKVSLRSLEHLERVVVMDGSKGKDRDVLSWADLMRLAAKVPARRTSQLGEAVRIDALATVMYTSGTTGLPKGIMFSQRNLVTKRFARALALPELGERDVFLSYLPMCHTFGRFLEMLGTMFWGASYCFAESPSIDVLVENMRRVRPTIFISIPQKWVQLYERIAAEIDVEVAGQDEISSVVNRITGGRLKWGLSAAGHLDPDIFRFFQRCGVELLSGFGMTEATGGITMTPPGEYLDDSLGKALPGVETRLTDEGELLIRGPYVMMGYVDSSRIGSGETRNQGGESWVATGDVMERDAEGHYRIVDRKKEIYKNTRGETIAPQRIENLFGEFDDVKRVFLVGDHRPFNTALIVPNLSYEGIDLAAMTAEDRTAYFRSHVVSVNRFLAPYERIIDFALLDRDFDEKNEELTSKGTYRRRRIEANFADVVDALYRRSDLRLHEQDIEIRIPRTLLQVLGLTARDFSVEKGAVVLHVTGRSLRIRRSKVRRARTERRTSERAGEEHDGVAAGRLIVEIGACSYELAKPLIDLGRFLSTPALWLGNEALVEFAELPEGFRRRQLGRPVEAQWVGRSQSLSDVAGARRAIEQRLGSGEGDLFDVHYAALAIWGGRDRDALVGLRLLERVVSDPHEDLADLGRIVLRRAAVVRAVTARRRAFQVLVPRERTLAFADTLERFLPGIDDLLDEETISQLCERGLDDFKLAALLGLVDRVLVSGTDGKPAMAARPAIGLLRLLAAYGSTHPVRFETIRYRIIQAEVLASSPKVRKESGRLLYKLVDGFRSWLGQNQFIAVDPENGEEYRWDDVITLEEEIDKEEQERLIDAIKNTTLIRESVFLFSEGDVPRLKDIPPGGVWISHIGTKRGRSLYRMSVRTRHGGAYDLAVNLNKSLSRKGISEELNWVVLTSEPRNGRKLVEKLGGYWPEHGIWTEEFAALDTVERALRRIARIRGSEGRRRLVNTWPYLAWNGLAAYFDFWNRTGRTLRLGNTRPDNVIVPVHDYHVDTRIISIANRQPFAGLVPMMRELWEQFVVPVEERYAELRKVVTPGVLFAALLEIVGERDGLTVLGEVPGKDAAADGSAWSRSALSAYLEKVEQQGFRPYRLHFAIERYRRWALLNPEAEAQARARTLQEIYETYGVAHLLGDYPAARLQFFRETVFRDAVEELTAGVEEIIERVRHGPIDSDELIALVSGLRRSESLGPDDDYFLARLSYPHLRPEDAADFVSVAGFGRPETDIVVTLEDDRGEMFHVRRAMNPKEVARLHKLFLQAKLDVSFSIDDQFLVAVGERGNLIGGIYYEIRDEDAAAHLKKIVVAQRYRKAGVSTGLMNELFNRVKAAGIKTITTGFFRPEYFYGYGFRIERRYAGLVKVLE